MIDDIIFKWHAVIIKWYTSIGKFPQSLSFFNANTLSHSKFLHSPYIHSTIYYIYIIYSVYICLSPPLIYIYTTHIYISSPPTGRPPRSPRRCRCPPSASSCPSPRPPRSVAARDASAPPVIRAVVHSIRDHFDCIEEESA